MFLWALTQGRFFPLTVIFFHFNGLHTEQDKISLDISKVNIINLQYHMFLIYWTQTDKVYKHSLSIQPNC